METPCKNVLRLLGNNSGTWDLIKNPKIGDLNCNAQKNSLLTASKWSKKKKKKDLSGKLLTG